jgi:hypothetical protein
LKSGPLRRDCAGPTAVDRLADELADQALTGPALDVGARGVEPAVDAGEGFERTEDSGGVVERGDHERAIALDRAGRGDLSDRDGEPTARVRDLNLRGHEGHQLTQVVGLALDVDARAVAGVDLELELPGAAVGVAAAGAALERELADQLAVERVDLGRLAARERERAGERERERSTGHSLRMPRLVPQRDPYLSRRQQARSRPTTGPFDVSSSSMTGPSSEGQLARHILGVLRSTGRERDADVLERHLVSRGWNVDVESVARLTELLAQATSLDLVLAQLAPGNSPRGNFPRGNSVPPTLLMPALLSDTVEPTLDQAFEPFLSVLPGGVQSLHGVNRMFVARSGAQFQAAIHELFVELFGYERRSVDETRRLRHTSVLRKVELLAQFHDFTISVVELAYPLRHANTLEPVLRLHPEGIVFARAPDFDWSAVAYRVRVGSGYEIRQRILVGRGRDLDPTDNVLVWAWRLSRLRPRFGDDSRALLDRAREGLGVAAVAIDREWTSTTLAADQPLPGLAWEQSWGWYQRAFVRAREHGWFWGIERVLRNIFPVLVGSWRLEFLHLEVGDLEPAWEAIREDRSWVARATLTLRICEPGHTRTMDLAVGLPVGTNEGRFIVDGTWYRFAPTSDERGRPKLHPNPNRDDDFGERFWGPNELALLITDETNDEGDDDGSLLEEITDNDLEDDEEEVDDDFSGGDLDNRIPHGASLGLLLEIAVARKLAGFAHAISRIARTLTHLTPEQVIQLARDRLQARGGPFELVSRTFLSGTLRPLGRSMTARECMSLVEGSPVRSAFPPAWACPEFSRCLEPGHWYPIAAARLTPSGGLAVPRLTGETITLATNPASALAVNPRFTSRHLRNPSWWVAAPIADFAHTEVGQLPCFDAETVTSCTTTMRVLRHRGARLRARMLRRTPGQARTVMLTTRVPATLATERGVQPELQIRVGQMVEPGQAWLRIPREVWASEFDASPELHVKRLLWAMGENATAEIERDDRIRNGQISTSEPMTRDERAAAEHDSAFWSEVGLRTDETLLCPHGLRGRVIAADLVPITYANGLVDYWNAVVLLASAEPECAVRCLALPDGRVVETIEWIELRDTPAFVGDERLEFESPTLVLEDPTVEGTIGEWRDGTDGRPLHTAPIAHLDVAMLVDSAAEITGPTWTYRRRACDGEGIPAFRAAPALSSRQRIWWAASSLASWAAVADHERQWSGGEPPWAHALRELLTATRQQTPASDDGQGTTLYFNPTLKANLHLSSSGGPSTRLWTCHCGAITGASRRLGRCSACGTAVYYRVLGACRRHSFVEAATVVLHPWHKLEAATILGLTRAELEARLSGDENITELYDELREACWGPEQRPLARLDDESEHAPELGLGLWMVRRMLERAPNLHEHLFLDLSRLPLLEERALPLWLPPGAPRPVKSAIVLRYRELGAALRRLRKLQQSHCVWLINFARGAVQTAIDGLFGDPDMPLAGPPTTLAHLVARVWPLSRPARLRSVVPGNFSLRGWSPAAEPQRTQLELEVAVLELPADEWSLPWRAELEDGRPHDQPRTIEVDDIEPVSYHTLQLVRSPSSIIYGVATASGVKFLPDGPRINGDWTSPSTWARRQALARLVDEWLVDLITVIRSTLEIQFPSDAEASAALFGDRLLASLGETSDCRELVDAMEHGLRLPDDTAEAIDVLQGILEAVFVGDDDEELDFARYAVAESWAAWWRVPVTSAHPLGWRWNGHGAAKPDDGIRVLPSIRSRAWLLQSGATVARRPLRWLESDAFAPQQWPTWLRRMLGYDSLATTTSKAVILSSALAQPSPDEVLAAMAELTEEAPPQAQSEHVDESGEVPLPAHEPMNELTAPQGPETEEIVILSYSLMRWLNGEANVQ